MNSIKFGNQRVTPSKIVCVGRNYAAHIEELGNTKPDQMVVFIKPNSAITDNPSVSGEAAVDYEGEICFLCREGKYAGVGFGLDLTKREIQDDLREKGLPWERSKAFDGSAVFSSFVEIGSTSEPFELTLQINGNTVQHASSTLMLYPPQMIYNEISSFLTLLNDDVVMTGTPAGVGKLHAGDKITGSIDQAGKTLISQTWTATGGIRNLYLSP